MRQASRTLSLYVGLILAAGTVQGVRAAPRPQVEVDRAGTTITLNGSVLHTGGRIANQRAITFAGSPAVLVVWDEYRAGAKSTWFALSRDGARADQVMEADNRLHLRYADFDPLEGEPQVADQLRADAANELFIVQFVATPLDEMRREVGAAGGVIERYIPGNAHIVRMSPAAADKVRALSSVRWVGAYHPAYRVSDEVRADILAGGDTAIRYSVETMRDGMAQQNEIGALATAAGGTVDVVTPDMHRLEVTVSPRTILEIARRNEVSYIDPWGGPGGHDMDIIRQLGGAVPTLSNAGFLGQGVRGEVFDGGTLATHQEWAGQAPLVRTTNAADAHGTACYGVNFATGVNAQATGMCPQREQGIISRYQDTTQFGGTNTRLSLNTAAVNPTLTILSSYQTSSVGSAQTTAYTTISQEVDSYLFAVDYLSCQSQSNLNTQQSRPQAWAKNIVSVGGIDHKNTLTKADDTSSGASFGPAADGRHKPDLAHSYLNVFTTGDGITTPTNTFYGEFSGTSSATPITAGHFGLLLQMWHSGVWSGFGGGSTVFADRPKSTTAKALMVNTAYRYPTTSPGVFQGGLTRARQGWGMCDLGYAYNIRAKTFIVNETDAILNAQTRSYTIAVQAGEPELRVTMCYLDPAPATTASPNRVNDLSLRVTSPSGVIYWGNNGLDSLNFSAAGGVANTVDTVENVFLQSPAAGNWTVDVVATSIVQDARLETVGITDADFALVVTGGLPPVAASCYANCDGSLTPPCVNVLDFSCFLNRFAAGDSYANCDNSTTPPVLNVLDFSCFINTFAAGCSNC